MMITKNPRITSETVKNRNSLLYRLQLPGLGHGNGNLTRYGSIENQVRHAF